MRVTRLLLIFGLVISFGQINAQHNLTKEADEAYLNQQYFNAVDLYKKAFSKETKKDEKVKIIYRIGECYRFLLEYEQAAEWYEKAEKAQYPEKELHLNYANVLKMQGKYDQALAEYKSYQEVVPSDPRGQAGVNSCNLAKKWIAKPSGYEVRNVVQVNSKYHDFDPEFRNKKRSEMYFSSSRPGSSGQTIDPNKGQAFTDIFQTTVDRKGKWSTPKPVKGDINSDGNDGSPTFNSRKTMMFFTRCESEKNQIKACQILQASLKGQDWDVPTALEMGSDTFSVGHPCMNKQDNMLFFSSDMPGGKGGKDIYYMPYDKKAKTFGEPVNIESINTDGDDLYPFARENGDLYFASNGHPGMGGLDIFRAESMGNNNWGNVENMRAPINGAGHDFGIVFDGPKDQGYFSSIRSDGKGYSDIYSFKKPPIIFVMQGKVTDVDCKKPIPGATVKLIGTDGSSVETQTNEIGFYKFDEMENGDRYIAENTSYTIVVSKHGNVKKETPDCKKTKIANRSYLNGRGQETTIGHEKSTAFVHDFELQCSNCGEIKFPKVLYPLAKWDLLVNEQVNSKDSLDFLYQTLVDNPTIVIELIAHTDSRDSEKNNQVLSDKRAKTCVDYLISRGIPADRMVPRGAGESQPYRDPNTGQVYTEAWINSLGKGSKAFEDAHQTNRRTVFEVLRDDYVPKAP